MATGKVKWFNNAKGYGFILADEGNSDLFAHYSSIMMDGYKTLKAGQDVLFEITDGPKGLQATNIRAADVQTGSVVDPIATERARSHVVSVTVDGASVDDDGADAGGSALADPDSPSIAPGKASRSN